MPFTLGDVRSTPSTVRGNSAVLANDARDGGIASNTLESGDRHEAQSNDHESCGNRFTVPVHKPSHEYADRSEHSCGRQRRSPAF